MTTLYKSRDMQIILAYAKIIATNKTKRDEMATCGIRVNRGYNRRVVFGRVGHK